MKPSSICKKPPHYIWEASLWRPLAYVTSRLWCSPWNWTPSMPKLRSLAGRNLLTILQEFGFQQVANGGVISS